MNIQKRLDYQIPSGGKIETAREMLLEFFDQLNYQLFDTVKYIKTLADPLLSYEKATIFMVTIPKNLNNGITPKRAFF